MGEEGDNVGKVGREKGSVSEDREERRGRTSTPPDVQALEVIHGFNGYRSPYGTQRSELEEGKGAAEKGRGVILF